MGADLGFQFHLEDLDPGGKCAGLANSAVCVKRPLKIQQIPIKPTLMGYIRKQAGVMRRDGNRRCLNRGLDRRPCLRGRQSTKEQSETIRFALRVLEYPEGDEFIPAQV
jgi:hypothetical protein